MTSVPSSLVKERLANRSVGSVRGIVAAALMICGLTMLGFGLWAFLSPDSFGAFINYAPYNEHLMRDVGAFQLGIGATVLLTLRWRDAIIVALVGYVVASAFNTLSHYLDREVGGHATDLPTFAALTLIGIVGLWLHVRGRTS
jgi:hypothetical protein